MCQRRRIEDFYKLISLSILYSDGVKGSRCRGCTTVIGQRWCIGLVEVSQEFKTDGVEIRDAVSSGQDSLLYARQINRMDNGIEPPQKENVVVKLSGKSDDTSAADSRQRRIGI